MAATADATATVAYLDGSDATLTDADAGSTGLQAALSVGANTIKVQVTARDRTTIQTYTLGGDAGGPVRVRGRDPERSEPERGNADAHLRGGRDRLHGNGGPRCGNHHGDAGDHRRQRHGGVSRRERRNPDRRGRRHHRAAGGAVGGGQHHQGAGDGRGRKHDPDPHAGGDAGGPVRVRGRDAERSEPERGNADTRVRGECDRLHGNGGPRCGNHHGDAGDHRRQRHGGVSRRERRQPCPTRTPAPPGCRRRCRWGPTPSRCR